MTTIEVVGGGVFVVNESIRPSFVEVCVAPMHEPGIGRAIVDAGEAKDLRTAAGLPYVVTVGVGVRVERRTAEGIMVLGRG